MRAAHDVSLREPVSGERGVRRHGMGSLRRSEIGFGALLMAPALVLVAGIYLYPALFTLTLSVTEFDVVRLEISDFVGFKNYSRLFSNPEFAEVVWRTIYFGLLVSVAASLAGFAIALLLNQRFYGRTLLRVIIVLPWAVPPVVAGVLWGQMFHADVGFVNALLFRLGLIDRYQIWLGDGQTALHVIAIAEIWKAIPFMVLFFLAGLQTVPRQLFEAASVDGATIGQSFRFVLLPLMLPIAIPLMLIQFVWAMKAFDTIFVLTRGGPADSTTTLNYYVYREAFQFFEMGRASAAAYVLLLVTLFVVLILALVRHYLRMRNGGAF